MSNAKAKKSIREFISENKTELFNRILRIHQDLVGKVVSMNRDEIRIMIFNEPSLAQWATENGCLIASKVKF